MSADLSIRIEQIEACCSARWQPEAGFREVKQEIGSAAIQTQSPDAVSNRLNFCLVATTLTWIYAAHLPAAPRRRYASQLTTEYAFAAARRCLAKHIAEAAVRIDCAAPSEPQRTSLIAEVVRLVA